MSDVATGARLIGFRVGSADAALPIGIVREVTERPRVVRVPGSHEFVSGVVLHGGVALPVYDLRRFEPLWSRPDACAPRGADAGHLIVCDWGEVALGVLGDRVDLVEEAVADEGPGESATAPYGMSEAYVKRVLRRDGEAIVLLDTDRLFASLGVPAAEPRARRRDGEDDPAGG
ncbi:MAG TPA: chemotaxis protein CheW [Candidatus Polarisedimenticolia bacterium]|nr:chemotaxis protein CheW [Candidatus Polarisedimenticolia bacterium]